MTPIFADREGRITVAEDANGNFVSGTLDLTYSQLRTLVDRAGVRCYVPEGCAVYADNRMISFFPKTDVHFIPNIETETPLRNLVTGRPYDKSKPLHLLAKSGVAFLR